LPKLADPRPVTNSDRAHQSSARGQGEEGVAKADQATRRDHVLEAHTALLVVGDLDHLAASFAERLGHAPDVLFAPVDGEAFDRLHALAIDDLDDRLGPRHLELVTLAPPRFDPDREGE